MGQVLSFASKRDILSRQGDHTVELGFKYQYIRKCLLLGEFYPDTLAAYIDWFFGSRC